jgi:hypothetical protein
MKKIITLADIAAMEEKDELRYAKFVKELWEQDKLGVKWLRWLHQTCPNRN